MEESAVTNVCRVCLTEEGEFQSLFVPDESTGSNIHLAEMLMAYASVQITLGDGMPEQICLTCAKQASGFYVFKQRCEESDTVLRNKLGKSPFMKPYSIQEEEKLNEFAYDEIKCVDIIIKPEIGLDQDDVKPDYMYSDEGSVSDGNIQEDKYHCGICLKLFQTLSQLKHHKQIHVNDNDTEEFIQIQSEKNQEIDTIIKEIDANIVEINSQALENDKTKGQVEIESKMGLQTIITKVTNGVDGQNEVDNKFKCVCGLVCVKQEDFNKHECDSSKTSNLVCNVCCKVFTKVSHLTRHLKIHAAIKPHVCILCNKGFARAEQLSNHMNMHSGVKPHICKICSKGFNQISNLKDHMRTHNGEKPFLCSTCGKGFNQLGNLRQHTIRHSGIKAHLCSICGNGFASKGELCAHLRKHTGARPFVCSICNHGFTTSSSLTKHKRIHSGEKPYECEVCKMKFSRSGILARHKRTHTGEKPYVCKYCAKAFSQSNDLSSHLRIHTGEKPYICDTCGQAFRQSSALKTHKKTHIDRSSMLESRMVIEMVHTSFFNGLQ